MSGGDDDQDRDDELEELRRGGARDEIEANLEASSELRLKRIVTPSEAFRVHRELTSSGKFLTKIKARKSDWIHNLIYLDGAKFSFLGRRYLREIYDAKYRHKLLKTGRQVEKCLPIWSTIHTVDGLEKQLGSVVSGDALIGLGEDGRQTVDRVVASASNGQKPCLKIKTRLGSTLVVTNNHPLRTLLIWCTADELVVGDRIAALRSIGKFGKLNNPDAALVGLLFGDGCFSSDGSIRQRTIGFTCKNPEVQRWFEDLVVKTGQEHPRSFIAKSSGSRQYSVRLQSSIGDWFGRNGLFGMVSNSKALPDECFAYDEPSTRELLRGLWATDGHCKNVTASKVDLVYCSTSPVLARQVRLLLRKFGVVTVMREYQPKKGNLAYLIRVVTRRSIEAFHKNIGPIPGKPFSIPDVESNSNLDTIPREIHDVIDRLKIEHGYGVKGGPKCLEKDLGFRLSRKYAPTFNKIAAAQKIFGNKIVQKILDADIIWDEVISIEDAGVQETWAIQTETETYLSDFVVQHNSTMLANEFITNSVVQPYHKSLYVSPSHDQTRQFSNAKLRPWIEDSPLINNYFQSSAVSKQVFEKSFTNGSIGFLRSAFLNADRTRGISADDLYIDELQDILTSNLGVIQETQSHAPDPMTIYSGTPKTLDNTIEIEWQNSSMCEWLVPCEAHAPLYWNFLDERNIGKKGPICKKCGKPINPATGRWVSFNDNRDTMGFRISQLMVPWMLSESKWRDLLVKYERQSKQIFYNEVLGISYDSASKPVTRTDLLACCSTKWPWRPVPDSWTSRVPVFAGVDWGEGSDGTERDSKGKLKVASYTVLALGTYISPKQFHCFYYRRFKGKEAHPEVCVPEILRTLQAFGVKCVGVDWGHGWGVNSRLEEALGINRVIQFQHVGNQKERKKLDEIGLKYQLNRNETISEFINLIKDGNIFWPEWHYVADFLTDIEHIFTEYNEYTRMMRYDHKPSEPDDAMHATIYCWEAAKNFYGYP